MCIRSSWSGVMFKSRVSLLVFCLDDLSNAFSEMLMSPSIIVRSSKSFLRWRKACFVNLGVPTYGAYIFKMVSLPVEWYPLSCLLFLSLVVIVQKVCFIWYKNSYSCSFLFSISIRSFSTPLLWACGCHYMWDGSLEDSRRGWVLSFYSFCHFMSFK